MTTTHSAARAELTRKARALGHKGMRMMETYGAHDPDGKLFRLEHGYECPACKEWAYVNQYQTGYDVVMMSHYCTSRLQS